jgi:hypothetical protein
MDNKFQSYACHICGLLQDELPWGEDGKTSSFNICDCCGCEFGYNDATDVALKQYREDWVNHGKAWYKPKLKPLNWSFEKQIEQVPLEFQ